MWSKFRKATPKVGFSLPIIGLVFATCLLAFPVMFSTLAAYDDEGYVMMTLQTYMQGSRLYGDTYTQYGPAYYLITAPIHTWLGLPLTQDAVRLKSICIWLGVSIIAFLITYRHSQSKCFAFAIGILCSIHLQKLSLEPGHPQEVALMASVLVLLALTYFPSVARVCRHESSIALPSSGKWKIQGDWVVGTVAASFFASIAGWTKLNCGVVVAIPLVICVLHYAMPRPIHFGSKLVCGLILFSSLASVVVPGSLIAWNSRSDLGGFLWAMSGTFAAAIFVYQSFRFRLAEPIGKHEHGGSRFTDGHAIIRSGRVHKLTQDIQILPPGVVLLLVALLTSASIVLITLEQGVTLSELWYGMVGQHRNFSHHFYQPIRLKYWIGAYPTQIIFCSSAVVYILFRRRWHEHIVSIGLIVFCIAFVGLAVNSLFHKLEHGLEPMPGGYLLSIVGPWVILLAMFFDSWNLKNNGPDNFSIRSFGISLIGIISPWIAFPVAGTQVELGTIPTLIAISICLWDRKIICELLAMQFVWMQTSMRPRMTQVGFVSIAILLLACGIYSRWEIYRGGFPLALKGSSLLRLSPDRVDQEVGLVREILRVANSTSPPIQRLCFEGHNNNRFYFWTGLKPLTAVNPTFWPRMVSESHEAAILTALKNEEGVCVVRVPNFRQLTGDGIPRLTDWTDERFRETSRFVTSDRETWQIGRVSGEYHGSILDNKADRNQLLQLTKTGPAQISKDDAGDEHHNVHEQADHLKRGQGQNTQHSKAQVHEEEQSN